MRPYKVVSKIFDSGDRGQTYRVHEVVDIRTNTVIKTFFSVHNAMQLAAILNGKRPDYLHIAGERKK